MRESQYDFKYTGLSDNKSDDTTEMVPSILLIGNQTTVNMILMVLCEVLSQE